MNLLLRRLMAVMAGLIWRGYGRCYRCYMPWPATKEHCTPYTRTHGCFPLCETCWKASGNPEDRLPYYHQLYALWLRQGLREDLWPAIEAAVREEK